MTVVDTSVWSANLRGTESSAVRRLRAIDHGETEILVGDLVLLEVLQGARDDAHAARIEAAMRRFKVVPMLDATLAVAAARNFRLLRSRGITIRKTIDMIIGTFCIENGHALLHDDRDFDPLAEHLKLLTA